MRAALSVECATCESIRSCGADPRACVSMPFVIERRFKITPRFHSRLSRICARPALGREPLNLPLLHSQYELTRALTLARTGRPAHAGTSHEAELLIDRDGWLAGRSQLEQRAVSNRAFAAPGRWACRDLRRNSQDRTMSSTVAPGAESGEPAIHQGHLVSRRVDHRHLRIDPVSLRSAIFGRTASCGEQDPIDPRGQGDQTISRPARRITSRQSRCSKARSTVRSAGLRGVIERLNLSAILSS